MLSSSAHPWPLGKLRRSETVWSCTLNTIETLAARDRESRDQARSPWHNHFYQRTNEPPLSSTRQLDEQAPRDSFLAADHWGTLGTRTFEIMSRDAPNHDHTMERPQASWPPGPNLGPDGNGIDLAFPARMQYRSRPVSVAVDPVSLVISECIAITSAIQKHARSPHSSVSAILGGSPNLAQLGASSPGLRSGRRTPTGVITGDTPQDAALANRWGLRGKKGKSMQDNPLMAGFGKLKHELTGVKGTWLTQDHPEAS